MQHIRKLVRSEVVSEEEWSSPAVRIATLKRIRGELAERFGTCTRYCVKVRLNNGRGPVVATLTYMGKPL